MAVNCFARITELLPTVRTDERTLAAFESAILDDSDAEVVEMAAEALWQLGMRAHLREKL